MKFVFIIAAVFAVLAIADVFAKRYTSNQIEISHFAGTTELPHLLSMGPDPGGHTGATVTPETTKTGQPAVDSARQAASGGKTENSGPPDNTPRPDDTSRQTKK